MPLIPGIPTSILVAPDSFKGTLSAGQVAEAIGAGLRGAGAQVDLCPVADGGEGTLEALMATLDMVALTAKASDPLGREIEATFGLSPARRGAGASAIVEVAAASGLGLVAESERDAMAAGTFGTGELIMAAVEAGAGVVHVAVGGSASTDGGAGAIRAIRRGGGLGGARLVVLCDVRTRSRTRRGCLPRRRAPTLGKSAGSPAGCTRWRGASRGIHEECR